MNKTEQARMVICRLDEQAEKDTYIHRFTPLSKLLFVIVYIGITTSYNKYDLSGIMVMVLIPVILYQLAQISVGECLYRMRYIMPIVCAVGIVNPFLDKEVLVYAGNIGISGGMISMITLIVKGMLCLMMSYLLIATTSIEEICIALRKVHVPGMFVTVILLTYRFVVILLDEASIMTDAYSLRAPGQKGIHISAWGSFLGQLLLRTMDRAQALYESMVLRGYNGDIKYVGKKNYNAFSWLYIIVGIAVMVVLRYYNIVEYIGRCING